MGFSPRSFCLTALCKYSCAFGHPPQIAFSNCSSHIRHPYTTLMCPRVAYESLSRILCKILPHDDVFSIAVARRNPVQLACDSEPEGLHGNDTLDSHKSFTVHPLRRMVRL